MNQIFFLISSLCIQVFLFSILHFLHSNSQIIVLAQTNSIKCACTFSGHTWLGPEDGRSCPLHVLHEPEMYGQT